MPPAVEDGPPPHQHQPEGHDGRAVMHLRIVQRVEPCRARGDGLKPAGPDPRAGPVQCTQGCRIAPFKSRKHHPGPEDQDKCSHQHQFAVQHQLGPAPLLVDVGQDDKSQPAEDKQGGDRDVDQRVRDIVAQAVGKQREPGVVEGGYGVEQRLPEPRCPTVLGHKDNHKDSGADRLGHKGHQGDDPHQRAQLAQSRLAQFVAQRKALRHPDGHTQHVQQQGGKGHQTQASDLDQHGNHDLPDQGKGRSGIHHNQPRDSHRRGGGEQRVTEADRAVVAERKPQHDSAQQNEKRIDTGKNGRRA